MTNKPANCSEAWWELKKGEDFQLEPEICECRKWTIGESRCSCGSRRIYLTEYVDNIFGPAGD